MGRTSRPPDSARQPGPGSGRGPPKNSNAARCRQYAERSDFVYNRDAGRAVVLAAFAARPGARVYNIGTGVAPSLLVRERPEAPDHA